MHSPLVSYIKISPNSTNPRNHNIDTITIHHMSGNLSVESCGELFSKSSRQASSNYGIDSNGRIACYVEEENRSWCSSSRANDNRAITIEVANDGGADTNWHVSDKAIKSLILLLVDVCRRNNIKELKWGNDKSLIGQVDKQNMSIHRWFSSTDCPGPYLLSKHSYIANEVNKKLNSKTNEYQRYDSIFEVPEQYKLNVDKWVKRKILRGNEKGLDISEDMIRVLIMVERMLDGS